MKNDTNKVRRLVGTAILAAIVVVLQTMASSIHIGPFTITLSLVPIIIGAVLYGPASGAILGAAFGLVVCSAVITGADPSGSLMFQESPFWTLFFCMLKSTVAGCVAGLVSRAFAGKKLNVGVILAAVLCPICNTGILCFALATIFRDLAGQWASANGHTSVLAFIILGMVGINFLVEMAINIVLIPVILRILQAAKITNH